MFSTYTVNKDVYIKSPQIRHSQDKKTHACMRYQVFSKRNNSQRRESRTADDYIGELLSLSHRVSSYS